MQEFRLWICWQQRRSVPLHPLPLRSEEQIFWQPRCPASGPSNMGWHSARRQKKSHYACCKQKGSTSHSIKMCNISKKCEFQSEILIQKASLYIWGSELKSEFPSSWVNLRAVDVVSEIKLQSKEGKDSKHCTLFLLFGPPFSFWYKSSLFWKET